MSAAEVAAAQETQLASSPAVLRAARRVRGHRRARAERVAEWEQRCTALSSQLDDVVARNGQIDRELGELRGQLAARSAEAAADAAEKASRPKRWPPAWRPPKRRAPAAEAVVDQLGTNGTMRSRPSSKPRWPAPRISPRSRAVRADTAGDRASGEGARAAAQVDGRRGSVRATMFTARGSHATLGSPLTPKHSTPVCSVSRDGLLRERTPRPKRGPKQALRG
jgi:hypothetical protein